ncbi:hypothetical protein NW762_000845 [Fusarium torreyae]|uniref:Uncharacterized protein n=1 Tax=Fusarium torreyae TaxID=1237075 RepID=A0A9W8VR37_9HYPO|nr:hypothetical protein NW762_000845 [Fusarium torreyae]
MSSENLETTPGGLLICPIPEHGLAPFLSHALRQTASIHKDYLAEVARRMVLEFTASASVHNFAEFNKTHFELDSSQVPCLNIKILVFENAAFAEGHSLNVWRPIDHAHGDYTGVEDHVLNWADNLVNLSTKMTIQVHLCRPWRDFGLLSAAMAPLRCPGIALKVTISPQNWVQIPDRYLAFHKAMTVMSIRRTSSSRVVCEYSL